MNREQYIQFRKLNMVDHILFFYLKDNYDLLLDMTGFMQKLQIINIMLQKEQFSVDMMLKELDVKYELTFVENIQTKQIYDII